MHKFDQKKTENRSIYQRIDSCYAELFMQAVK